MKAGGNIAKPPPSKVTMAIMLMLTENQLHLSFRYNIFAYGDYVSQWISYISLYNCFTRFSIHPYSVFNEHIFGFIEPNICYNFVRAFIFSSRSTPTKTASCLNIDGSTSDSKWISTCNTRKAYFPQLFYIVH